MFIDFPKLFPGTKGRTVRIEATSPIQLKNLAGKIVHLARGEQIEIAADVANELDRSDFRLLDDGFPKVEDPTPARPDPAPLPESWKGLPECFATYWQINEEFRVAGEHPDLIDGEFYRRFGMIVYPAFPGAGKVVGNSQIGSNKPGENFAYSVKVTDLEDPATQKIAAYLNKGRAVANDYLARLRETKYLDFQKAYLECGQVVMDGWAEWEVLTAELNDSAFDLFSLRIKPLGLAQAHVRRLYQGSADCLKYHRQPNSLSGTRFAGQDASGQMRVYLDQPIQSMVGLHRMAVAGTSEAKALLVSVKKELATATKAA